MKIYYAHPMSWYGTEDEAADLAAIAAAMAPGTEIVNPNTPEFSKKAIEARDSGDVMYPFRKAVEDCDAIAYRTFNDDSLGAGVAQELLVAAVHGKQIFRIWTNSRQGKGPMLFEEHGLRASFGPRLLTIVETRDRIKRGVM